MAAPKPVRSMRSDRLKVFTGNSNPTLAMEICACLGVPLGSESGPHRFVFQAPRQRIAGRGRFLIFSKSRCLVLPLASVTTIPYRGIL